MASAPKLGRRAPNNIATSSDFDAWVAGRRDLVGVRTSTKFGWIRPALWAWVAIHRDGLRRADLTGGPLYWHGEVCNTSILAKALAVTSADSLSLLEFSTDKRPERGRRSRRAGRVDLWATFGRGNIDVEAKVRYVSAPARSRPCGSIDRDLDAALGQVATYHLSKKERRVGLVFALPLVARRHWSRSAPEQVGAVRDLLAHFGLADAAQDTGTGDVPGFVDFAAFYFPRQWCGRPCLGTESGGKRRYRYVGVLLVARCAAVARR
jgi:hypothetical protein